MFISDQWRDYEVVDCSRGEKLERWGTYYLVRPDPQVIWNTEKTNPKWEKCDGRYDTVSGGKGNWTISSLPQSWEISYGKLRFHVKPMNFKHTGIFPEQACNWDFAMDKIRNAGRHISVLNLFGYTGAATVACASAGADVCHVDAAKAMVAWGKENAALSGLSDAPIRWIVDDCAKFVEREIRRGNRYDALIMDPPAFGRGPKGEVWKLEECLYDFVLLTAGVLSDNPLFVIINSYTSGLSASVLSYIADSIYTKKFGGRSDAQELGLPVTQSGLVLPCGSTCRWVR